MLAPSLSCHLLRLRRRHAYLACAREVPRDRLISLLRQRRSLERTGEDAPSCAESLVAFSNSSKAHKIRRKKKGCLAALRERLGELFSRTDGEPGGTQYPAWSPTSSATNQAFTESLAKKRRTKVRRRRRTNATFALTQAFC